MVTGLAGRWEVGEDAGLVALAKAVEREVATTSGKQLVRVWITPPNGEHPFVCEGLEGMTLREARVHSPQSRAVIRLPTAAADLCGTRLPQVREHGDNEGAALLGEYLECACSGVMACSTCHVYVAEEWVPTLGPATEEEEDMLDLAYERQISLAALAPLYSAPSSAVPRWQS